MNVMVLFIGSLLLLGIVFTGTVDCKSNNANSAAPGQQAIKPGNAEGHSGAPGQTGANPDRQRKPQTTWSKVPAKAHLIRVWQAWRIGSISQTTTSPGTALVDHPSTARGIATSRSLLSESIIQRQVRL